MFLCVCVQSSQCMWLMQALGFLLSALPVEEILARLHALITPHVQQLDTLAQQEVTETSTENLTNYIVLEVYNIMSTFEANCCYRVAKF